MAGQRGSLCTTRCQLFNNEMTKTADNLRMKWYMKNRDRLVENLQDEKLIYQAKKLREKIEQERARRRKERPELVSRIRKLPAWRPGKPDGSVILDIMKPVDPDVREKIYEPKVESFLSTKNYLCERYKITPENRFYYPECTYWILGWRLSDYPPVPAAKFGKSSIIRDTFYRKNGSSLKRDDFKRGVQTNNPKDFDDILSY